MPRVIRTHFNIDELIRLYTEEEWSVDQLVLNFGASKMTIYRWFKERAVRLHAPRKWLSPVPKSVLKRLYVDERLSLKEVGRRLGMSYSSVSIRLKQFGIETRRPRDRYLVLDQLKVGEVVIVQMMIGGIAFAGQHVTEGCEFPRERWIKSW